MNHPSEKEALDAASQVPITEAVGSEPAEKPAQSPGKESMVVAAGTEQNVRLPSNEPMAIDAEGFLVETNPGPSRKHVSKFPTTPRGHVWLLSNGLAKHNWLWLQLVSEAKQKGFQLNDQEVTELADRPFSADKVGVNIERYPLTPFADVWIREQRLHANDRLLKWLVTEAKKNGFTLNREQTKAVKEKLFKLIADQSAQREKERDLRQDTGIPKGKHGIDEAGKVTCSRDYGVCADGQAKFQAMAWNESVDGKLERYGSFWVVQKSEKEAISVPLCLACGNLYCQTADAAIDVRLRHPYPYADAMKLAEEVSHQLVKRQQALARQAEAARLAAASPHRAPQQVHNEDEERSSKANFRGDRSRKDARWK